MADYRDWDADKWKSPELYSILLPPPEEDNYLPPIVGFVPVVSELLGAIVLVLTIAGNIHIFDIGAIQVSDCVFCVNIFRLLGKSKKKPLYLLPLLMFRLAKIYRLHLGLLKKKFYRFKISPKNMNLMFSRKLHQWYKQGDDYYGNCIMLTEWR